MSKMIILGITAVLFIGVAIIVYVLLDKETEGIESMVKKPDEVRIELVGIETKKTIDLFKATKGRLPKSIAEIEEFQRRPLRKLPPGKKYQYNPTTGEISIIDVPVNKR